MTVTTIVSPPYQQMRRKMLRQSLKELLKQNDVVLPDAWLFSCPQSLARFFLHVCPAWICRTHARGLTRHRGTLRPEVLTPGQFIELTKLIFGEGETPQGVSVWRGKLDDAARLGEL